MEKGREVEGEGEKIVISLEKIHSLEACFHVV